MSRRSDAARRVAAREAATLADALADLQASRRAGRFVTGAHGAATTAAIEAVPHDVRQVAAGSRATSKRDTSRRQVGLAGHRHIDGVGWNVESTRREWAGEDGSVVAGPLHAGIAPVPSNVPMLTGDGTNPADCMRDNAPRILPADATVRGTVTPTPTRSTPNGTTAARPGEALAARQRDARRR